MVLGSSAYTATVLSQNPLMPVNAQSWSYNLTAGADPSQRRMWGRVVPLASVSAGGGSLDAGAEPFLYVKLPVTSAPVRAIRPAPLVPEFLSGDPNGDRCNVNIAAANDVLLPNLLPPSTQRGSKRATLL